MGWQRGKVNSGEKTRESKGANTYQKKREQGDEKEEKTELTSEM